jgi:hypothetical protein
MSGGREGPARGQALFALASVAVLVVAMTWLDRVGPATPAPTEAGSAPSGSWICPHGGGPDLSVALFLANPGEATVTARVTELGAKAPAPPTDVEVPAGATVRVSLQPDERGAATSVEFFGGWIGADWVSFTDGGTDAGTDGGVAAEPCAGEASQRWFLLDGSTELGDDSSVVVANPFSGPAVLDVVLYTADRAPVRESAWTDLVVPARRSLALRLGRLIKGEPVVGMTLEVSVGRVAAASLVVSDRTSVRSTLGWTEPASEAIFPTMNGSGQTELLVLSTASGSIRFGATSLSEEEPRPAGGLTEQEHGPTVARAYAIPADAGPTAVRLFTLDGAPVAGVLRVRGPAADLGATAGAVASSDGWLLLPASARVPADPRAVLVNDGDADVVATVELLPDEGGTAAASVTVRVPAHGAAAVPPDLWASAPGSALVVRADGPVVALAATTSRGSRGAEAFALSMGVPLPHAS